MKPIVIGIFSLCLITFSCNSLEVESESKIVNGRVTQNSAVVRISAESSSGKYSCTGFWISSKVLLTAAHCITGEKVFVTDTKLQSSKVFKNPNYRDLPESNVRLTMPNYDIAAVYFADANSKSVIEIGPPAEVGDEVSLIGFGADERGIVSDEPFEAKNRIASRDQTKYSIAPWLKGATSGVGSTSVGDSGGPLISRGKAIGVSSFIEVSAQKDTETGRYTLGKITSYFHNLNFQDSAGLISQVLAFDKNPNSSSAIPGTKENEDLDKGGIPGSNGPESLMKYFEEDDMSISAGSESICVTKGGPISTSNGISQCICPNGSMINPQYISCNFDPNSIKRPDF